VGSPTTPGQRILEAIELTELAVGMLRSRLRREGKDEAQIEEAVRRWHEEPGTHRDSPWFRERALDPRAR
jgi:hypothetical protein